MAFNVGDQVYLRLHQGYSLPEKGNPKLSNQRSGPYLIKKKVGSVVYELNLPSNSRIHLVISVAQLEPAPKGDDPFNRPRPDNPGPVHTNGDTETKKSFEVERILKKRVRKYGRTAVTQYMVK
jgi:hypothetical protein